MSVAGKELESDGSDNEKLQEQDVAEEHCVILAVEATELQSTP